MMGTSCTGGQVSIMSMISIYINGINGSFWRGWEGGGLLTFYFRPL